MDYLGFLSKENESPPADKELMDFYRTIIDKMMNAFALHKIIFDDDGQPCDYAFIDVNPSFEILTGLKKDDILGRKISEVIPNIKVDEFDWIGVYSNVAIKGESISFESFSMPLQKWFMVNAYSPQVNYFVTIFIDISQTKSNELDLLEKNEALTEVQKKLHYLACNDRLTGLPNRASLHDDIKMKVNSSQNSKFAIFYIDFDNLKLINTTLGYELGEEFLIEVGNRLSSLFGSDNNLYRINGPEFILLLNQYVSEDEINACAERIIECFKSPIILGTSKLYTTVSIGIALYPGQGESADELLRNADISRITAKNTGKNRFVIYKESMYNVITERMAFEKHLYTALENNEFEIYYQPQLDLTSNKICGFEALLRWRNPELGYVLPAVFINVAEFNHLIIPIGSWVIRNACYFIKKLQNKGYIDFTVAVNVSIVQLSRDDFVDSVLTIIELIGLDPKYLEIEITESVFIESYEMVHKKLERLRECGIKIALDDFGKGYSSLSGLQYLPVDILKVDKIFIDSITNKDKYICITDMIILLGRKMGMKVLAEGVETQEQKDYLIQNNCHMMQGYLFSKPLPESEIFERFINDLETDSPVSEFQWKSKYSVKIDSIDDQHKRLFELGHKLSKLVFSDEKFNYNKELVTIFEELHDYIEYHFKYEESCMEKHGYMYLKPHKIMHNNFIKKVQIAYNAAENNNGQVHFIYLIDMVSAWITKHILNEDVKFGQFLSDKQGLE